MGVPYFPNRRSMANPAIVVLGIATGTMLLTTGLSPVVGDVPAESLRIAYSVLPRAVISLVAGAVLALSGMLYQQLLRNPLAEPATLGVTAGSHLALVGASLFLPVLLDGGRLWVAGIGGIAATGVVALVVGRRQLEPVTLIVAGMLISLFCSGLTSALTIFNHEYLSDIYVWQSGNLRQMGWHNTAILLAVLSGCWFFAWLLRRPLAAAALGDEILSVIGVNMLLLRTTVLFLATLLGVAAVSTVGVIAFLGFLAPALARLCGARTVPALLLWAPLQGAALLFLADAAVQRLPLGGEVPTGTALAIIGAPFLTLLLWRRSGFAGRPTQLAVPSGRRAGWPLTAGSIAFAAITLLAVTLIGRSADGSYGLGGAIDPGVIWQMRTPRTMAVLAAGSVLAISGVLLQRATGNDMASPEILGISSAAALGVLCMLLFFPELPWNVAQYGAAIGACLASAVIMGMCLYGVEPLRLLLSGMALTIICSGLMAFFLAGGDPRASVIISWLSGSTYNATVAGAAAGLATSFVLMALALGLSRIIGVLPLGDAVANGIGMPVARSRMLVFLLAAMGTACGTMLIGPLTFIGLVAPHLARRLGSSGPRQELLVAAALGATTLMLADWIGRNTIHPWQLPAGIVAAIISGPFVLLLLRRAG